MIDHLVSHISHNYLLTLETGYVIYIQHEAEIISVYKHNSELLKSIGEKVKAGNILVRQLGTRIHPGINVGLGKDYTIFAKIDGTVAYERLGRDRKKVSVYAE